MLKAVAIDLEGGAVEVCSLPVPGVDVKDSKRTFKFSCSASGILSVLGDFTLFLISSIRLLYIPYS